MNLVVKHVATVASDNRGTAEFARISREKTEQKTSARIIKFVRTLKIENT